MRHALVLLQALMIGITEIRSQEDTLWGELSEGMRAFAKDGKMGFMDAQGKVLRPPTFSIPDDLESLPRFKEGLCMYFTSEELGEEGTVIRYGFLDRSFRVVIPAKLKYAGYFCGGFPTHFSNGLAVVDQPETKSEEYYWYTIIDRNGRRIGARFKYDMGCTAACAYFPEISEGYCVARMGSKFGFVEAATGDMVIPGKYSTAGPFSEGLAAVEVEGRYLIFIDKSGRQALEKRFHTVKTGSKSPSIYSTGIGCEHPGGFVNGRMYIEYFDNEGKGPQVRALIDRQGNVVLKKKWEAEEDVDFEPYKWRFGRD